MYTPARGGTSLASDPCVDYTTEVLYHHWGCDEPRVQAWLQKQGCTFEPGRGGHLTVRLRDRITDLPMHGKQKELGTGLVHKIKKALGLE